MMIQYYLNKSLSKERTKVTNIEEKKKRKKEMKMKKKLLKKNI